MKIRVEKEVINGALTKFCECLTDTNYDFDPAIGRENEIEELMITILTPGKSSLLIGKPGVGKTAILEGLAYRIQKDAVPKSLKNYIIYKTSAAMLNSNCIYNGMLEKNVLELFKALEHERNVILFIDEIHTLVGTGKGTLHESLDIANIIKPFITSDNIHLIGATTNYEYEEYIQGDPAFSRRFENIMIEEPHERDLESIINNTIEMYSKIYKVKVDRKLKQNISSSLLKYTKIEYRNPDNMSYNPDLSISIIAKAFGYARLYDHNYINEQDFIKAYNTTDKVNGKFKIINCTLENKEYSNLININKSLKQN